MDFFILKNELVFENTYIEKDNFKEKRTLCFQIHNEQLLSLHPHHS